MSYTLIFTDSYRKRAKRFAQQHPELQEQYRKTLLLLAQNPYHPSLRLHPLKGKLAALHSLSINISYRITLEMIITERTLFWLMWVVMVRCIKREQLFFKMHNVSSTPILPSLMRVIE